MWLKFLKNILEGLISVKLQVADRLLEVGLSLRYFADSGCKSAALFCGTPVFHVSLFEGQLIFVLFFGRNYFL